MSDPDPDARMMEHLVRELAPYGIGADRLAISYEDYLQDYDVLISGEVLTEEQIGGIIKTMPKGGCFRFTLDENERRWSEALGRKGLKLMKAQAAEARLTHPDLPKFDRSADTLADFVQSLEVWAGVAPGSTLKVLDEKTVQAEFTGMATDPARIQKHLVVTAVLADENIDVLQLIGLDAGDAD